MRKLVRSPGYLRWKRALGYVYIVSGLILIGEVLLRAHSAGEMLPGLLLGGAFTALGVLRVRSLPT
ncbi:MAG: hypothetical protein KGM44_00335 [bacterium]|nr:hypothetical protein [bacterium]